MMLWQHIVALVPKPAAIPSLSAEPTVLGNVFNVVLALAGAIAIATVVFSGIKFSLAKGDQNKIKVARDGVLYASIGLVVVASAFLIVNYVIGKV